MNTGNPLSQNDYKRIKTKVGMNSVPMDLSVLNNPADSRYTAIHAKVNGLIMENVDLAKLGDYGYSKDSLSDWLKGRHPVPLRVLKDVSALEDQIEYLSVRSSSLKIKIPKLDEKLAYFLGVIFGDGHVSGSVRKKGYRIYRVVIQKKRTNYSEFVIPTLIESIFGDKPNIFFWKRKSELITITLNSKVISRFFTNIFNFKRGKKSDQVFDFIENLPAELQLAFVIGLFDTDGGRSGSSFAFCNSSYRAALFVKTMLGQKGVKTRLYHQTKNDSEWYLVRIPIAYKKKFLDSFSLKNKNKFATGGI